MAVEENMTKVTLKKKKERDSTKKKKAIFPELLFSKGGFIKEVCRSIGISRQTYYRWMESDEKFRKAVKDEQEGLLDFAESKLFNLINDKHPTAIIFFLKTKGRHRGYIERTEMEFQGSEKKPLRIILENANPNHGKKD